MRSRVISIAVAAVLAIVGVVAVAAYVRQANVRAIDGQKAERVLTATSTIPQGTSLSQAWKEHWLTSGTMAASSLLNVGPVVASVTQNNGQMVLDSPLNDGEILTRNMLVSAGTSTSSSGLTVPAGMIAVSLDVCVPEDVAGYVTPGAYVALFNVIVPGGGTASPSCSSSHPAGSGANAILVLASVEVLKVGEAPAAAGSSAASSGTASSGDVDLTLAVKTQAQVEQVIEMQQAGVPYLALPGAGASLSPS